MQLNKSKRVRSACNLRNFPLSRPFSTQKNSIIERDSFDKF